MTMTGKPKPTEQDIKQLRDLEEYEAGKCRTITPDTLAKSEAIKSLTHLMGRRHREETLNEDADRQGHSVYDVFDLWKDRSEMNMSEPGATREDLQEETFKWIRRFRELLTDQQRTEAELAGLRNGTHQGNQST